MTRSIILLYCFFLPSERLFTLFSHSFPRLLSLIYIFLIVVYWKKIGAHSRSVSYFALWLLAAIFLVTNAPSLLSSCKGELLQWNFLANILFLYLIVRRFCADQKLIESAIMWFCYGYVVVIGSIVFNGGYYISERLAVGGLLPNSLAYISAACGLFYLYYLNMSLKAGRLVASFFWGAAYITSSVVIVYTASRSGFIMLISILGVFLASMPGRRIWKVVLFVVVPLLMYTFLEGGILGRALEIGVNWGGRDQIWSNALNVMEFRILGLGYCEFNSRLDDLLGESPSMHNFFIESFAYGGALGLLLVVSLFTYLLYRASLNHSILPRYVIMALFSIVVIQSLFSQFGNSKVIFFLVALMLIRRISPSHYASSATASNLGPVSQTSVRDGENIRR